MRKKPLAAFPYYGGKTIHLKWLLPLLPKTQCYVEPFGGSAAVLLNRAPSPVEVYNDLDSEVVNFFRCLREDTPRLHRLLRLTPHSREEFKLALEYKGSDPYERARCFLIRIRQVRSGKQIAKDYHWGFSVNASNNGMSSKTNQWQASLNAIQGVANRLSVVQIENRPATKLLTQYDSKDTLFYCDPPYAPSSRKSLGVYTCEMTTKQHKQFLKIANSLVGKVAISGYDTPLYNKYLASWYKYTVLVSSSVQSAGSTHGVRSEVLWTNYKPLRSLF